MIYRIVLDGRTYEVEVDAGSARVIDEYVTVSDHAGAQAQAAEEETDTAQPDSGPLEVISSPVPGTILSVEVAPGQYVKEGETVVILEAMKMENEISASVSGTVTKVFISKGAAVDTGAPLVVIG